MEPRQIVKRSNERMITVDLESDLLQNRIIFITGIFNEESVATYQAELMYLASQITDKSKQIIRIFINSPGGDAYSFFGLYDIMQNLIKQGYIIQTRVVGLAASAGAFTLLAGSPGYRFASPYSRIMIHQNWGASSGTVTDMKIDLEQAESVKKDIVDITNKHSGRNLSEMLERDKWLSAKEALELGLIDEIK